MPYETFTKEWNLPSSSPTPPGRIIWDSSYFYLSADVTRQDKEEISVLAVPVLGRFNYQNESGISFGLGLGAYLLNISRKTSSTDTYLRDSGTDKTGDTILNYSSSLALATVVPAVEITTDIKNNLSDSMSWFFGLNITVLGNTDFVVSEQTRGYYPDGVSRHKINIKEGVGFGGIGGGAKAGIALKF
ncbi:MAG: hypothetical protein KKH91_03435 [Elusimicrobia bacterium]|nr:hypothetical protein [Elusimicrobiota bacterium]MBU2614488.1 hypothetical protein [Elusimicrobiota bacterium]